MAIDFARQVYFPSFNVFARPIIVTPLKSQPLLLTTYDNRGVYNTQPLDIAAEDSSIFSDQITVLDILEFEFLVVPIQGDLVWIPASGGLPDLGSFEIVDGPMANGGGQMSFNIRKIMVSKP